MRTFRKTPTDRASSHQAGAWLAAVANAHIRRLKLGCRLTAWYVPERNAVRLQFASSSSDALELGVQTLEPRLIKALLEEFARRPDAHAGADDSLDPQPATNTPACAQRGCITESCRCSTRSSSAMRSS